MLNEHILFSRKRKTITVEELFDLTGAENQYDLHGKLKHLLGAGYLVPVKASGLFGVPDVQVYHRYRIQAPNTNDAALRQEISLLHPLLIANGYLTSHPEKWESLRYELKTLSDWLWSAPADMEEVAVNERAWQIWGREKALEAKPLRSLLASCGIDLSDLHAYQVYDDTFLDYIASDREFPALVVSENKSTWDSIRRLIYRERQIGLFGVLIDGVVFGSGNKVCRRTSQGSALDRYAELNLKTGPIFYYWGDLDLEGLSILSRLLKTSRVRVEPMMVAYIVMIDVARKAGLTPYDLEPTDDTRTINDDIDGLVSMLRLPQDYADYARQILQLHRRLPQEAVSIAHMRRGGLDGDN